MIRPRHFLRNLLLLLTLFLLTASGVGSARSWEDDGTFFTETPFVSIDMMRETCPVFRREQGECVYDLPVLEENCEIIKTHEIGVYGGGPYMIVQTLQSVTYGKKEGDIYECQTDEVALFKIQKKEQTRLIWHSATEREVASISDVKLYSSENGKSIMVVLYCMRETGECVQQSLIWTGVEWKKLEWDDSKDATYRNLPEGYHRHNSALIDFGTLTWEEYLAGPDDLDCCPTGRIIFELELLDNKLSVKSYRFSMPVEETEEMRDVLEAEKAAQRE